jgi:hypothetical protein
MKVVPYLFTSQYNSSKSEKSGFLRLDEITSYVWEDTILGAVPGW